MWKKVLCNPITGFGYHVAMFCLLSWVVGTPQTAAGALMFLAAFGLFALGTFFIVTSYTYRSNGTSGGVGVTFLLLVATVTCAFAFPLAAAFLGVSIALLGTGAGCIALASTAAIASLSD